MSPGLLLQIRHKTNGEHILLAVVAVYVLGLCVAPLVRLFVETLFSETGGLGFVLRVLSARGATMAAWHTLESGVGSMLVSLALGTGAAMVVALTDVRARSAMVFLFLLPMLIPAQISAVAWLELTGPSSPILALFGVVPAAGTRNWLYSREGVILIMGIEHSTMVFLAVRVGLRKIPRDLIEAARSAGTPPARVIMSIILPLLRPSLLAGAALAFVAAIGNFGIPAILGIPGRYTTLTAYIYQRLSGFGPSILGEVGALSMALAALAALGLGAQSLALRREGLIVASDGTAIPAFCLGRWRWGAEAILWAVLAMIAILPLCALVGTSITPALGVSLTWSSATLDHFRTVFANAAVLRAFINSLGLSTAAAVLCSLISLPFAYFIAHRKYRVVRVLHFLADAPFALPGIVVSIACILSFIKPIPGLGVSVYGTSWLILIAYLSRFLALGLRPALAGMEQMDPGLEEAAQIAGARLWTRLRRIVFPLAAPGAGAGALLIFMSAFTELTVSALLWSSGHETVGVMIFNLYDEGNAAASSAISVLSLLVLGGVALVASVCGRLPKGTLPWQA